MPLTALSQSGCGMPSVNPDDNPAEGYRIQGKRKKSGNCQKSQKQEENPWPNRQLIATIANIDAFNVLMTY